MDQAVNFSAAGYISSGKYIADVHKNLRSGTLYGDAVSVAAVRYHLDALASYAEHLDQMKKTLFYGKDAAEKTHARSTASASIGEALQANGIEIDLFHGLLGLITEVGEIAQALSDGLKPGGNLDRVNLHEEQGDCFWYHGVVAKVLGKTFDQTALTNTVKLSKRYPENFTEDSALNRDLAGERELLERQTFNMPRANEVVVSFVDPDPREEIFTSGSALDS